MQAVQQAPVQPTVSTPPSTTANIPEQKVIMPLTGLRFLPLMAIVWHHSRDRFTFMHGFAENVSFVHGVAFFFVLSGFILTYRYNYVKDLGTSMHFFLARTARLWPMHVFCLSLLLFLIPEVFKVRGELIPVFFCNFFMLHSWVPLWNYYFSFNGPSWSSATLSFFDFAFPFLFLAAQKSWTRVLAITAGFVVVMISLCNIFQLPMTSSAVPCINGLVYINPLARLLEFTTGIVAALAFQKYSHKFKLGVATTTALEVGILGLIAFITLNSQHWKALIRPWATEAGALWIHNTGVAFIPCALLITVLATERGWVSKFFGTKWMGVLGDMSFALYMLHGVFIAYFTVNFHDETSWWGAFYFFSSLLVAAHLMHNFIIQPMRKQVLKNGTKLLSLKWPAPPRPPSKRKPKDKAKIIRGRMILAAEVLLFGFLMYNAMPTIHRITPQEAATVSQESRISNIGFEPSLRCQSATAKLTAQHGHHVVALNSVWEALEPQSIDYFVGVKVFDSKGQMIGFSNYKMDGRHQQVAKGALWKDTVDVVVASEDAASVSIKLNKGRKRKIVTPQENPAVSPTKDSILVPIVASAGETL